MLNFLGFFLDLIFPINCLNCGQSGSWVCQKCWPELKLSLVSRTEHHSVEYFEKIWVVSGYQQSLLPDMLHLFKYQYVAGLGQYFSQLAVEFLSQADKKVFDYVIPVPLSKKRLLQRGFNQAEIIAQAIASEFGWPIDTANLVRTKHTHPQVGLNAQQRLVNVQGIFSINHQSKFRDQTVLLVDDVLTTGATMQECAKLLKQSGAKEVFGLVIFRS